MSAAGYPDGAERLSYPGGWVRAMVYESTARQLTYARWQASSQRVADALAVLEYAQPPRPDDKLADVGATYGQLYLAARCYGMDPRETDELIAIAEAVGMSGRHAALIAAAALQRQHEVDKLRELFDRPPAGDTARAEETED